MKKQTLLLIGVFLFQLNFAQVNGGQNEKLRDLFNLEKYEDCAFKAMKMSESSKYQKDPEVYLYLSMCYHKLYEKHREDPESEYNDALRDALKYALKFKFKDRSKTMFNQNLSYLNDLKTSSVQEASYYAGNKNFRKSANIMGSLYRFEKDHSYAYYKGVMNVLSKNMSGKKLISDAVRFFNQNKENEEYLRNLTESQRTSMSNATIHLCDMLKKQDQTDSVKNVLSVMHKVMPENYDITTYYNQEHEIKDLPTKTKNGINIVRHSDVSLLKDTENQKLLQKDGESED